MLHPKYNLAILGLSRSGTTVVAQSLVETLSSKYDFVNPTYQGEISNVFRDYFFIGENKKIKDYVDGAYIKSFDMVDGYIQGCRLHKNVRMDPHQCRKEMSHRMDLITQMIDSKFKTIVKVHPYAIWKNYQQSYVIETLSKLNYIYVRRENKLEHFLSFVIARESGIYHTDNLNETFPNNIIVTTEHMELFQSYLVAEKWFLEFANISETIVYEDLGEIKKDGFVKKLPYTKPKIEYIVNKQEVLEYIECLK
tara:strand:- start:1639 stop:2394 length:756 start_codon:yes stop_codon:yes gene_type:complete